MRFHVLKGWMGFWLLWPGIGLPSVYAATVLPNKDIMKSTLGWSTGADANSLLALESDSDPEKGTVLKLKYDLGTGKWVALTSQIFPNTIDLSHYNAFTFFLKGDGLNNRLQVEIKDSNAQVYKSPVLASKVSNWQSITLPFSQFTFAFNADNQSLGTGFDWSRFFRIGFTVTPQEGGGGTVAVDELTAEEISNTNTAEILLDDGENASKNNLNSSFGNLGTSSFSQVSSPAPLEGAWCRRIVAGSTDFEGCFERIDQNDTTPLDATSYAYLTFYLQIPSGLNGNLTITVKDKNSIEKSLAVQNYFPGGIIPVNSWQKVQIPLSDFSAASSLNFSNMGQFLFLTPPNSTVYFDRVSFNNLTYSTRPAYKLDTMDTYFEDSSWGAYFSDSSHAEVSSVAGNANGAIQMNYQFPLGAGLDQWVNFSRGFGLNLKEDSSNGFVFDYKGTGAINQLEIKLHDAQGLVFRAVKPNLTNTGTPAVWKTMRLPYADFQYFTGSSHTFDFRNVSQLEWVISNGNGGSGTVWLNTIQYLKLPDFSGEIQNGSLIENFSIDYNPFAPQSGRNNAKATFSFTLKETAEVQLKIYNLAGKTVKTFEKVKVNPAACTLTWDGLDQENSLVRNGLYLYQFTAEGATTTQKIKNVIGVVR